MKFSTLAVIPLVVVQMTTAEIGRFGAVGRSLSESEVAQIAELTNRAGKAPWLMLGDASMIRNVTFLTVYLEPDVTNTRLHRGQQARHRSRCGGGSAARCSTGSLNDRARQQSFSELSVISV